MKRTKLLTSLMMCVMCLSFLVVGVWAAAVSVNFNLNAGLKYYPEGVYVELSGQVYRGGSADNLTALTYDPRFTLEPITNYDNSTGKPSGNFPMESWEIGSIPFIPTEKVVKIEVTITNHSDFTIAGIPDITIDNLATTEIESITVTDNSIDLFSIASNANAVYELILEVTSTTDINSNLSVSFDFYSAEVNYDYFTINDSYQITGLTQTYIDDSPEVLVIPGYTQDGLNRLSFYSNYSLNGLTASSILIFGEGIASFPVSMAPYVTQNIEIIVIPSTLSYFGNHFSLDSLKKAYFVDPNGWMQSTSTGGTTYYTAEEMSNPENAAIILKGTFTNPLNKH